MLEVEVNPAKNSPGYDMKCRKCGKELTAYMQYCYSCGIKASKTANRKKDTSGNNITNRWKMVSAAIIGFIIIISLIYMYLSIGGINITPHASTIIGDGKSPVEIPLNIVNELNMPVSAGIVISSNEGNVSSIQESGNGNYSIIFIPPKTAHSDNVTITVSAQNLAKNLSLAIMPDVVASMQLAAENPAIPADGTTGTRISALAKDRNGEIVPDGTRIAFALKQVGQGRLADNACITENGSCLITYIGSTTQENISISASSGNIEGSIAIVLEKLPPNSIVLLPSNDTLNADGESSAIISVTLKNKLGVGVSGYPVNFSTDGGRFSVNECTTDSGGECSVTYVAANVAGQAQIEGCTNTTCGRTTIALRPVSEISVLDFNESAYIGGNPVIVPAFAINNNYLQYSMAGIIVENNGSGAFEGHISVAIPDWTDADTQEVKIPQHSTKAFYFNPKLNSKALTNNQLQNVNYLVTIQDNSGLIKYQNTYPTELASFNTMEWNEGRYTNLISAWISPNANSIHNLISNAAGLLPNQAMIGYTSTYTYGCGSSGNASCTVAQSTNLQLNAIYAQIQLENMHYVNAPFDFSQGQTVYTPTQSLNSGGANCIDGTLVFASAVMAADMDAYIAIVPQHAFVCVAISAGSSSIECIETTMIGSGADFNSAVNEGNSEYRNNHNAGTLKIVDVRGVLSNGISTLP